MKKNNLLKAIAIVFVAYVVLTWIIPGGTFSSGKLSNAGVSALGLGDIFIYPISTAITSIFVLIGLCILLIGGLYGVMNKTGAYKKIVEGLTNKFSGREKTFLIISIVLFALLSSLTTLYLPLFVLVPLFVAVILSLGYDKMTALLSTVGAILVGMIGSTTGYNIGGYNYINYFFGLDIKSNIVYKIALFVLVLVILVVFIIKTSKIAVSKSTKKSSKDSKKEEKVIIPLYNVEQEATTKKATGLVVMLVLTMVISLVAMFNWAGALGIEKTWFDTVYNNIITTEINGYPLFSNLFKSLNPFGYWSNYEFAMLLVIATVVVGKIYKLRFSEIFESAVNGMKEMIPVAVVAIFANVMLLVVNSVSADIFPTIANAIFGWTKGLNAFTMALISAIGSITYTDFPYLMNIIYDPVKTLYSDNYSSAVVIMQALYGFMMMIVPTSVVLMSGLSFLNISYTDWFKKNWKLLLCLLVAVLAISVAVVLI